MIHHMWDTSGVLGLHGMGGRVVQDNDSGQDERLLEWHVPSPTAEVRGGSHQSGGQIVCLGRGGGGEQA